MSSSDTLPLAQRSNLLERVLLIFLCMYAVGFLSFACMWPVLRWSKTDVGTVADWHDLPNIAPHQIMIPHEGQLYFSYQERTHYDTWIVCGKTELAKWPAALRQNFLPSREAQFGKINRDNLPKPQGYISESEADFTMYARLANNLTITCNYRSSDGQFTLMLGNNKRHD